MILIANSAVYCRTRRFETVAYDVRQAANGGNASADDECQDDGIFHSGRSIFLLEESEGRIDEGSRHGCTSDHKSMVPTRVCLVFQVTVHIKL